MRWPHISCLLLAGFLLTGCGGVKYGKVSGKIGYKGSALAGGTVTFWPQAGAGAPAQAVIQEDATYTVSVPVGEVIVTVETESLQAVGNPPLLVPKTISGGPPPEELKRLEAQIASIKAKSGTGDAEPRSVVGKYVPIHLKYGKPETSGLKSTILAGQQEFNIDLK